MHRIITVILCAKFQNDSVTRKEVMDKRALRRFSLKMSSGWISILHIFDILGLDVLDSDANINSQCPDACHVTSFQVRPSSMVLSELGVATLLSGDTSDLRNEWVNWTYLRRDLDTNPDNESEAGWVKSTRCGSYKSRDGFVSFSVSKIFNLVNWVPVRFFESCSYL